MTKKKYLEAKNSKKSRFGTPSKPGFRVSQPKGARDKAPGHKRHEVKTSKSYTLNIEVTIN